MSVRAVSPVRESGNATRSAGRRRLALFGGGTDGNEQLTATTGLLLVGLLAVIGITILRIGQLAWVHLFVGLLLIGPVALKMASTGYRFLRCYANNAAYRRKGTPAPALRLIAPMVVTSTIVVFVSGLLLLFEGPVEFLKLHNVSFIVWAVFTGLHVLGHLPGLSRSLRAAGQSASRERQDVAPRTPPRRLGRVPARRLGRVTVRTRRRATP